MDLAGLLRGLFPLCENLFFATKDWFYLKYLASSGNEYFKTKWMGWYRSPASPLWPEYDRDYSMCGVRLTCCVKNFAVGNVPWRNDRLGKRHGDHIHLLFPSRRLLQLSRRESITRTTWCPLCSFRMISLTCHEPRKSYFFWCHWIANELKSIPNSILINPSWHRLGQVNQCNGAHEQCEFLFHSQHSKPW